jgi:glycosyltransferase involved in cell wall biosynthesis
MRELNLLQMTLSLAPGGRRQAILSLSRELRALGAGADLVCLEQPGLEAADEDSPFGRTAVLDRQEHGSRQALARLIQFCDERSIRLIHAHDAASQFLAARLRLARPRIKVLMTFHRSLSFESARFRDKLRNAMAALACSAIVVGSRDRRDHYLRENFVPSRKVVRIPFGVDMRRFRPDDEARQSMRRQWNIADDEVVVGVAGHFGPEKGVDIAIGAFLAARRRQPNLRAKLLIVGRGTSEQTEQMHALAQPAGDTIRFLGFRRDIERCFQGMDLLLHAPRQEAFGLVVAEAMASGLPVVATRVGGIPDLVREGQTGLLALAEQPDELGAALVRLVENEPQRKELAARALRVAAAEYSAELYARRHLELYHAILSGRRPVGASDSPLHDSIETRPAASVA